MDITITIGDQDYPGRLPFFPTRYLFAAAYHEHQPRLGQRSSAASMDTGCLLGAAIGLCWAGEPLDCPSFRECGRDVIDYGEAVIDALIRAGHGLGDIVHAGGLVSMEIIRSLPTEEEIEEAAAPFADPVETSTGSTS